MGTAPPIAMANIGMADTLILMVLALVVFGPRRLPQIGRQLGRLMYEFRKASNDFKFQMEEELRQAEEADRRKREELGQLQALAAIQPLESVGAQAQAASAQASGPGSAALFAEPSKPCPEPASPYPGSANPYPESASPTLTSSPEPSAASAFLDTSAASPYPGETAYPSLADGVAPLADTSQPEPAGQATPPEPSEHHG